MPLKNHRAVPGAPLAGKIVIDTNNYYPERDGHIPELDNESTTTSELLQAHLPASKVVKAFNHIRAAESHHKATVAALLDRFGFDTVDAGLLKEGCRIQRDTPRLRSTPHGRGTSAGPRGG